MILERLDQIKWTSQGVFDHVVKHLLEQGEPAKNIAGDCLYRIHEGTRTLACAVGCLIPDRYYSAGMEDNSIYNLLFHLQNKMKQKPLHDRLNKHRDLLNDLQQIHDHVSATRWPDKLRELAADYELEYNGPSGS